MSLSKQSWWACGLILVALAIHFPQVRLVPQRGDVRAARLTRSNALQVAAVIYAQRTRVTIPSMYDKVLGATVAEKMKAFDLLGLLATASALAAGAADARSIVGSNIQRID